tara:strand:+ start:1631 stop:1987 length:357 start_codon:yes stop_codon:yes gene_type:complete
MKRKFNDVFIDGIFKYNIPVTEGLGSALYKSVKSLNDKAAKYSAMPGDAAIGSMLFGPGEEDDKEDDKEEKEEAPSVAPKPATRAVTPAARPAIKPPAARPAIRPPAARPAIRPPVST